MTDTDPDTDRLDKQLETIMTVAKKTAKRGTVRCAVCGGDVVYERSIDRADTWIRCLRDCVNWTA